ncbi:hypothetical protein HD597_012878 [Nonomuraea thailandensis]|uniref:Uncharacterized protein n=1 Tax=Nonomuraea thailandensis TaxID=1188745 RepID=A0A9X2GUH9_9ACTN|nr:hypothetical protein [Nonomuraea thailandensis]MCP2365774.1 hypothetical protein [Nonomuraea thailandensis]
MTERERMLEAYRWASCLTERCWDPAEVSDSVGLIYEFLSTYRNGNREDFTFLVRCLELQIMNYGLHPTNCRPDEREARLKQVGKNGFGRPLAKEIVKSSEKLLEYVTDDYGH